MAKSKEEENKERLKREENMGGGWQESWKYCT